MRILILAIATIIMTLYSCKKSEEAPRDDNSYQANFPQDGITVSQGETYTSDALVHNFPAGAQFSIKEIKNNAGKTSSVFQKEYEVGTWSQTVNKTTDLTVEAVLSKYSKKKQTGVSINGETGAVTILGKATQELLPDTYNIVIQATVNGQTTVLADPLSMTIVSGDGGFAKYVRGKWKYADEGSYSVADVTVNKLSGAQLASVQNTIPNYNSNRSYVRLKIADARGLGISILEDIIFSSGKSLQSMNPWIETIRDDDAIILSSAIDRFPVLVQDSLLSGQVQSVLLANKKALQLELSLNITSEGIYDVTVKLSNHPTQKVLWWPQGKEIYLPTALSSNNFNDNNSQWSYERMRWSDNFVVFWEPGLGSDPNNAAQQINMNNFLSAMEAAYTYYYNTMKFVKMGSSKADRYRTQVYVNDKADWLATGAGYDNEVGAMWINYSAANSSATMAHEVGHTFQYLNACDGNYAFTGNTHSGMFWEQTSQYQASLLYPTSSQVLGYVASFIANTHLNLLHEDNRYSNFYHLQYWQMLHGVEFVGQLWQKAQVAEDPIEAYIRLTGITQQQFNEEIYEYAKRTMTWDFLNKSAYNSYILSSLASNTHNTTVNAVADGYYQIAPAKCVQNYGFNALRLTVPTSGSVQVDFEGIKGNVAYNTTYDTYAGWRWGFVAISSTGTATYSTMNSSTSGTATFTIPANTSRLYFLVTGAPSQHFRHVWDDNPANDEQYPWKAKFMNTSPTN